MKKPIFLILILFCVTTIFAQTEKNKLALVIGNADYQYGGKLRNPVNDANLMTQTLQDLGFTVITKTDATKSEMDAVIMDFSRKLANYDVALFYYAGHGVQVNGINYLIPIDAKLDDQISVTFEAVDVSNIVKQFEYYPDNLNIVILDACRNNPFRAWQRGESRGFKAITAPSGTIISFATREGETAADGTGSNGLFTEQLVTQMNKPQSIEQVFKNTRVEVLSISGNNQCPQEWSMFTGDFYFTGDENSNNNNNNEPGWDEEYGSLQVYTEIPGTFFLDDTQVGFMQMNSQKIKNNLTTGTHTYKFLGAETLTGTIIILKDQTTNLNIQPTHHEEYGNLQIYTSIPGTFFLDDTQIGYMQTNSQQTKNNLTTGTHTYKFLGAESFTGTITILKDQTTNLNIQGTQNNNNNNQPNRMTDERDGKTYKTVEIGNQVWFAENLAYNSGTGCTAYKNEDINVDLYGYLYNWETAINVCPDGWHLPTKNDFETLINNTGGESEASYNALIPSGNSGFNILFGGYANLHGSFFGYEDNTYFWTKSPNYADRRYCFQVEDFFENAEIGDDDKDASLSVRCLKD